MGGTRSILLAAAALAALCLLPACRKKAPGAAVESRPLNAAIALDYPGTGDSGKNDLAWKGALEAAKAAGAVLSDGRATYEFGNRGRLACLGPKAEGRDRAQLVRTLAEARPALVILMGEAYFDPVKALAADFPNTLFVFLDAAPRADLGPNCRFVRFDGRQGAYLAGALAASVSATNDKAKLGFSGDEADPDLASLSSAWKAGALSEDPALAAPGRLLAKLSGADAPSGKKIIKGTSPAEAFAALDKAGATMAFLAGGPPSQDLVERAKASGIFLVCYPDDAAARFSASAQGAQAAQAVLGSVVKRFDAAVGLVLRTYADPQSAPAAPLTLGLKEGCVELRLNPALRSLTDPRMASIDKATAAVLGGSADLTAGDKQ